MELVEHLDIIAKDKAFIERIWKGKSTRQTQIKQVRNLLNPLELERYDAGMALVTGLSKIKPQPPETIELKDVVYMPAKSAEISRPYSSSPSPFVLSRVSIAGCCSLT